MSSPKVIDPRDPRRGLRGLDAPPIPGGDAIDPDTAARAEADDRQGIRGLKIIVGGLVGATLLFTFIDVVLQLRG
jgi:hypothetical protein